MLVAAAHLGAQRHIAESRADWVTCVASRTKKTYVNCVEFFELDYMQLFARSIAFNTRNFGVR
jgi:hypothetical protein